jgi:hypothetical protein
MRKLVSEKTLELNVSAEILTWVRGWPGGADAFWIGMKQYQEAAHGLDELLADMPNGVHLALQFKSPRARPRDSEPYRYALNDRQNRRLVALAQRRPTAVFYVFPNFNSFARIRQDVPSLSTHTIMFPAISAQGVLPTPSGRHRVDCFENPPRVTIHSQESTSNAFLLKELISDRETSGILLSPQEELIPNAELIEWMRQTVIGDEANPHVIGQRLRGFATTYLPG